MDADGALALLARQNCRHDTGHASTSFPSAQPACARELRTKHPLGRHLLLAPMLLHVSQSFATLRTQIREALQSAAENLKDERGGDCESPYVVEHPMDHAHVLLQLA